MVLMLALIFVLLMALGCGLWSALAQAPNAEGLLAPTAEIHLALKPSYCLVQEPHPLNLDPVLLQPLWSG